MKLITHFNNFLNDTVNLNTTRIARLESRVDTIQTVIRNSSWRPTIRKFSEQGSWAHKTIIKPVEGKPFDADLLVYVHPVDGWDAKTYIQSLRDVFATHGPYADKVKAWDYCVTITYAGDFKLDIAPCVTNRQDVSYEVCNRSKNEFQPSNPDGYTSWLVERNMWTGGNGLRKVTRLLKYLRNTKCTFTCPSVLFTTLLGYRINFLDQYSSEHFADVPTALHTIVRRLDDWLDVHVTTPSVLNPALQSEDFGHLWSDDHYSNFRDKIKLYREWIDDAYNEPDRDESIGKWRRVFGEEFAKGVEIEAASIGKAALSSLSKTIALATTFAGDMVTLVSIYGYKAIPDQIAHLPYMHRPKWRKAGGVHLPISVSMALHGGRKGQLIRNVSDLISLPKGNWVKFSAYGPGGVPLPIDFDVYWRITNTDAEAANAKQLRGEFYKPNDGKARWEQLSYRGVHVVEAFIVRKRDQTLLSQSAPCYVVIG